MEKKESTLASRLVPLVLTAVIVIADRITKNWIIANVAQNTIYRVIGDDLVWICHVRNTGIAFSVGDSMGQVFRFILFTVLPVAVMMYMIFIMVRKNGILSTVQRWFIAGIVGGGTGTLIDRILYFNEGVVDFISVKFFGILGLERWPAFNISDACVVVFVILLGVSLLVQKERK